MNLSRFTGVEGGVSKTHGERDCSRAEFSSIRKEEKGRRRRRRRKKEEKKKREKGKNETRREPIGDIYKK